MKPVLTDKTILRLQKITGQPISRGIDKTINSVLDQFDDLKTKTPDKKNGESSELKIIGRDCECVIEESNQKPDTDERQNDK